MVKAITKWVTKAGQVFDSRDQAIAREIADVIHAKWDKDMSSRITIEELHTIVKEVLDERENVINEYEFEAVEDD